MYSFWWQVGGFWAFLLLLNNFTDQKGGKNKRCLPLGLLS